MMRLLLCAVAILTIYLILGHTIQEEWNRHNGYGVRPAREIQELFK